MYITKIKILNYKSIVDTTINLNKGMNIFVGENDAGKSSILEALSAVLLGRINGGGIVQNLKPSLFNSNTRNNYLESIKKYNSGEATELQSPPTISVEVFFDDYPDFKGTNNSLGEDTAGVGLEITFDDAYCDLYKDLLEKKEIEEIPTEFYQVKLYSFKGEKLKNNYLPFKTVFIDTSKKDYSSVVDRLVLNSVSESLTNEEISKLSSEYKANRAKFMQSETINHINESEGFKLYFDNKKLKIKMKDINHDEWKKDLTLSINEDYFESLGLGTQNRIKVELLLREEAKTIDFILMEEPENNLSYTNMMKLILKVLGSTGKQFFISTHSSFVANKLLLNNILIVKNGSVDKLEEIPEDTLQYFQKLPGYDTLRVVLAEKLILVEGPTDELIIQRAYMDKNKHLPIEDGIDVVSVHSLAFKRYLDIARILKKKVIIVTDNDGNIEANIIEKYRDYQDDNFIYCYEKDESLNTIEPSVLNANLGDLDSLRQALSKNNSMLKKSEDELKTFMLGHKGEWALRIFNAEIKIKYPKYILEAINE